MTTIDHADVALAQRTEVFLSTGSVAALGDRP
jgi:hypothetical protein